MFETMYHNGQVMIPQASKHGMPGISSSSDFETQFATRDWTGGWRIGGFLAALLTGILLLTACGVAASGAGKDSDTSEQPSGSSAVEISGGKINVVATNSLLADLAGQVGGNLVEVTALVPPGIDVHAFQLKPSNNLAIGRADLLVSNGAGLDDFLNPVLRNSSRPAAKWIIVALEVGKAIGTVVAIMSITSTIEENTMGRIPSEFLARHWTMGTPIFGWTPAWPSTT